MPESAVGHKTSYRVLLFVGLVRYNEVMLTDEQKAMRRTGIGASECAVAVGLSDYQDPMQLYLRKLGLTEGPDDELLRIGHLMEPVIETLYRERYPAVYTWGGDKTLRHPEHPRVLATPDRWCGGFPAAGEDPVGVYILQMKNCRPEQRRHWGREGTDEIPHGYFCQVQWEMAVAGVARCDVAAFFGGTELRVYSVAYDEEIFSQLLEANRSFWFGHVVPQIPPPIDGGDGAWEYLKAKFPKPDPGLTIEADDALERLAAQLKEAKFHAKLWSDKADRAEAEICLKMGKAEVLKGKRFRATWRSQDGKISWKGAYDAVQERLAAALESIRSGNPGDATQILLRTGDIPEQHRGNPSRKFTPTFYDDDKKEP
jgi:putative phage-type endonuclease